MKKFKKQVSIDLGYYNGDRIRHIETVYSKDKEKEVRAHFSIKENKEIAFKKKLIEKGCVLEPINVYSPVYLNEYMVKVVTKICNERIRKGKILIGTKIGYLSDSRYISNHFDNDVELDKITLKDIELFLDKFAVKHSKTTMDKAVRILRWVFQVAK